MRDTSLNVEGQTMETKCELCPAQAELFCEADQAYVCWKCDSNVHGANFLVARHHRVVLCRRCRSPTLWRGSGARFQPTSCLCPPCQSEVVSTGSEKQSNEIATQSAVLSSASSSTQNLKRQGAAEKTPESETSGCTSFCPAKNKIARYSSGRINAKKQRTLIHEHAPAESSSDSTLEDSSDEIDRRETDSSTWILELAFKWTEFPPSPKISRGKQSLISKIKRMPD